MTNEEIDKKRLMVASVQKLLDETQENGVAVALTRLLKAVNAASADVVASVVDAMIEAKKKGERL